MKFCVVFLVVFGAFMCGQLCLSGSPFIGFVFPSRMVSNVMSTKMADTIGDGIKQAMDQCNEKFKWKQWNCPKSAFSRRNFQKMSLTKEIAFARALTTAGIMHSLTQRCAKSGRSHCDCNTASEALLAAMDRFEDAAPSSKHKSFMNQLTTSVDDDDDDDNTNDVDKEVKTDNVDTTWSWGGCSDDPGNAEKTTQQLFATFEAGNDVLAFAEKQNNLVGRRVVRESLRRMCRCHGLSGSCSHQTCWMQVAPFEDIANDLMKKYKKAIRISQAERSSFIRSANVLDERDERSRKIKTRQLMFLDESPNYCYADESTGWPGTMGRLCVKENSTDPEERKSCQQLCRNCGYDLRKETRVKQKRCNCAFRMCCEVRCEVCDYEIEEYYCA